MEIKETSQKSFKNNCNVVVAGKIIEATQSWGSFRSPLTKKISKYEYLNLKTGEIIEVSDKIKNKDSNLKSVRQTIRKIRQLVNSNFSGNSDEYFITLTYKENMTDTKKLYFDFDKFIKKLKYKFKDLLYIGVVEPQGRGAWHVHLLIKNVQVTNDFIADLWGYGFTYTSILNNVDNVGAYISAYLTNTKDKKGARLNMYPQNMKIYRYSRNCKRPLKEKLFYKDFYKKYKHLRCKYVRSYDLFNGLEKVNSIIYKSYEVI